MAKTFKNTETAVVKQNVNDVKFWGDGDTWKLISKASSENEGWMKSTKAIQLNEGCLVQVTTQQRNLDDSYSLAEAIAFAPKARISEVIDVVSGEVISRQLI
jgi:hypothetical protein